MAGQSEVDVAGLELERVEPMVETLFDRDDIFYSGIEKVEAQVVSNRDMRIPLEMSPGGKPKTYNPDGGDMGRGGGPDYDKALINVSHQLFAVEYTELSDMATDSRQKAVLQNARTLTAKGMASFRRYISALLMTAGNGVLATVTAASIGGGTAGGDRITCTTDGFRVKLLQKKQDINIYDTTLATQRTLGAERTINYVDLQGNQFDYVPTLPTVIATDKVVFSGAVGANPVNILGVPYHYNNASVGTWLGFSRVTTPEIRANRVNAGGALALSFARRAINAVGDRTGLKTRMKCEAWTHPAQTQAYEQLGQLVSQIHKQAKAEGLNLYFGDDMQLAGCPLKEDYMWDRTRIDFIDKSNWGRVQMAPVGFYESGGQRIFPIRGQSGGLAAAHIFYLRAAINFYVKNPAQASYIDALAVPTGY